MKYLILLLFLVACSPVYENPEDYCQDAQVYECGNYIKVVQENKDTSYYKDNKKMVCPFSAIEKMNEDCQSLYTSLCSDIDICTQTPSIPVGGQKDSFGCSSGYSFNQQINACTGELDASQKSAAKIAVDYHGWKKGLTVQEVQKARCPGCFYVIFDDNGEKFQLTLYNWEVDSKLILT